MVFPSTTLFPSTILFPSDGIAAGLGVYQSSFQNLVWGAGTDVQLTDIDGIRGMPSLRSGDVPRARRNGSFPGQNFYEDRIVTMQLEVFPPFPSGATFEQVLASMGTAFENIEDPDNIAAMATLLPGWLEPRVLFCRPTGYSLPVDSSYQYFHTKGTVQFTANDPLYYGSTLKQTQTGLPAPTAGMHFNATFDVAFGASVGGSMQVENDGTYLTPPVIQINGPVTNPIVTLNSSGAFFGLTLTLGAADSVVIDMNARIVVLNGTASRFNAVLPGSSWFAIAPGTDTISCGSSDATSVTALFTCQYRDAWGSM